MNSALNELKIRADLILARARRGEPPVLARLAGLPPFQKVDQALCAEQVQRKHALWLVAREYGFRTWNQARDVLLGSGTEADFGTMLMVKGCGGYLNNWYAGHDQAAACRRQTGGFLLAYRRQFLVVGADYIDSMGLDWDDPDWKAIGRDWARPDDLAARGRLYGRLIARRKRELD